MMQVYCASSPFAPFFWTGCCDCVTSFRCSKTCRQGKHMCHGTCDTTTRVSFRRFNYKIRKPLMDWTFNKFNRLPVR